ncbi:Hypothetical_protein [Hexamita inflata]|uniref:Hypothetical_protein n=1 Tax=Hexamita inflata TaxID=28002 RepID=A0ABP1HL79_9EUKA
MIKQHFDWHDLQYHHDKITKQFIRMSQNIDIDNIKGHIDELLHFHQQFTQISPEKQKNDYQSEQCIYDLQRSNKQSLKAQLTDQLRVKEAVHNSQTNIVLNKQLIQVNLQKITDKLTRLLRWCPQNLLENEKLRLQEIQKQIQSKRNQFEQEINLQQLIQKQIESTHSLEQQKTELKQTLIDQQDNIYQENIKKTQIISSLTDHLSNLYEMNANMEIKILDLDRNAKKLQQYLRIITTGSIQYNKLRKEEMEMQKQKFKEFEDDIKAQYDLIMSNINASEIIVEALDITQTALNLKQLQDMDVELDEQTLQINDKRIEIRHNIHDLEKQIMKLSEELHAFQAICISQANEQQMVIELQNYVVNQEINIREMERKLGSIMLTHVTPLVCGLKKIQPEHEMSQLVKLRIMQLKMMK